MSLSYKITAYHLPQSPLAGMVKGGVENISIIAI
jgi:hypothetical protein